MSFSSALIDSPAARLLPVFLDPRLIWTCSAKEWALWEATSPEERSQVHTVHEGPLAGHWSLNQAALFTASRDGLGAQAVPGSSPPRYADPHAACYLQAWSTIAPSLTEAELDQPLLSRELQGDLLTLTARGLRALAHWEWAARNHWGPAFCPVALQDQPWSPITANEVRLAVDTLRLMHTLTADTRSWGLARLFAHMALPPDLTDPYANSEQKAHPEKGPDATEQPWHAQLRVLFAPEERALLMAKIWRHPHGLRLGNLNAGAHLASLLLLRSAPPARPWTEAERAQVPDVWADLNTLATDPFYNEGKKKWAKTMLETPALLDVLGAWGFSPTEDQWNRLCRAMSTEFLPNQQERFVAQGRHWFAQRGDVTPDQPRRRLRTRT
jgi:hypothetical protein